MASRALKDQYCDFALLRPSLRSINTSSSSVLMKITLGLLSNILSIIQAEIYFWFALSKMIRDVNIDANIANDSKKPK